MPSGDGAIGFDVGDNEGGRLSRIDGGRHRAHQLDSPPNSVGMSSARKP